MNAATKRHPVTSDPGSLRHEKRAEMLNQYTQAIDQTILSFQQAYQRAPQDERLMTAFAQFCRRLDNQLTRLKALKPHLTDEREVQTLEETIRAIQSTMNLSATAVVELSI
jgi:hypothetical protein